MSDAHIPLIRKETLGLLLGAVGVVIFGATLPMTHIALEGFSPAFITFGRAAVASVLAIIALVIARKHFPRGELWTVLGAGAMVVFAFPWFSSIAMQTVPASHGGVVLGILPLATVSFAALIGGERPSPLFWLCAIAGSALVITFAVYDSGMQVVAGDLWLLAAGISVSFGYVLLATLSRKIPGWEAICWALIVTLPASLAGTVLSWQPAFLDASGPAISAFLYLAAGSMFFGFFAWNTGMALGGTARVSQVQLLQSFVTIGFSALLIGEHITARTLFFAAAVTFVVFLGRKARVNVAPPHPNRVP